MRDALYREVADAVVESDREQVIRLAHAPRATAAGRGRSLEPMRTLTVALGERSYPIHVGAGLLATSGELLAALPAPRVVIVTNPTVAAHHLGALQKALSAAALRHDVVLVPDGEAHKDWATLHEIHTRLLDCAPNARRR